MGKSTNKNASKILGIQFSILSPEEIVKSSVAEITSRDTYINNKPVIGGLFDPRMGILDPGLICPTDGLDYMSTPGYFGHINLARPVFYIQYLNTIIKILRCVCIKCSKLLINKETYKQALNLSAEDRWNFVFQLASKIKRCGEDSHDGCGCLKPKKIKKEGLATLYAEWEEIEGLSQDEKDKLTMKLSPEIVLKIFRRISDEDVSFMGFSPTFSRPDWMICQVLAVPPPAVRPSIKMDGQQRSEDDISHIIVNIIKANKSLLEKMNEGANANVIDDLHTLLQYYIATQIDNKIPGVASVAQRSGRPLKSIKERLNGKAGRVRGNLMGKRVDYSARSVITPDPNLSIKELGIPLKVAKNITKPVKVNNMNKKFLTQLVINGPDEYPGAKVLERKNGEQISLRYADRENISLEYGDIVHRHMMNGDGILFNRQPTLHRMSMMCHIAVIMYKGDTFRMNVGDTKPYNADFDGDEMNLHMPQDEESEAELKNLAAAPYQIVSPANNASIIGIFQDSLLGCYRFTRPNINFNIRQTMNLLMSISEIKLDKLKNKESITSFDILSQIVPPLTLKYKTKHWNDEEDYSKSNNVIEITNGNYIRGQMEKGVLGSGGKGLLQRICNYYGNQACASFIDNLQNIVTEYMKSSAYSVGISDLIADKATNEKIVETITDKKKEVKSLIDQVHLGIFENNTGKTNEEEFETQVTNILNKARSEVGKIGRNSLSKDNRFVIMVNAGSKGGDLNISQMISCLGQQEVDGKRIPYGFDNRTLPHYTKYDDSPSARGFVESSFISGLTPEELFFHAMGGRTGLIDTAVKTSQTGYIQRRLIKGMEDLKIEYDMTVRNNKGKIIEFSYGDDGIDTVRVENQILPLVNMNLEEIYAHYNMPTDDEKDNIFTTSYTKGAASRFKKQQSKLKEKCKSYIDFMITSRDNIVKMVFKNKDGMTVHLPVAFQHILNNVQGMLNINKNSMVDITPLETFEMIENNFKNLEKIRLTPPTELFKVMYYYYLTPKDLLMVKRFNKKAMIVLLEMINKIYKNAIVAPGEMVGMIAAQSIGEPTTQMTLNTFHFAGVASKSNVTRGVPRIEEILSLSENPKNPSVTICLRKEEESSRERAQELVTEIEYTKLQEIVKSIEICFDPDDLVTLVNDDDLLLKQYHEFENMIDECIGTIEEKKERSKWIIRMEMDKESMLDKNISMDDINFAISNIYSDDVSCIFSDYNSDNLVFRLRLSISKKKNKVNSLDQSDEIYVLKNFQEELLNNIVLRGIKNIHKVNLRKVTDNVYNEEGKYVKRESWVLDTIGTNLMDILSLNNIDVNRTISNDIQEIYRVFGIEAARQAIFNELSEVLEFDSTYINYHHLCLLCDRMTYSSKMISIFRHGINNDDIGPIAKASFEETPEMFLKAARHAELDAMRGVSANVMCGQEGYFGTNSFQIIADMDEIISQEAVEMETDDVDAEIMLLEEKTDDNDCSKTALSIQNNALNINKVDLGDDDDYNIDF
jgi:DNA-directed RNA polymerase II subunit RPB1